ncbi:MAG: hypothetical protein WCT18_00600 [Patescibacteria group bacterium]
MHENLLFKSFKFVFREFLFDVLAFPLWWYTTGTQKAFIRTKKFITDAVDELGVVVWIKNLFVPMYGQYDWQGRLISFVMRFFQIIFRSVIVFFWMLLALLFFVFWLFLPIFIVGQIVFNLSLFKI